MTKQERKELALQVVVWFDNVMQFLSEDNWEFSVDEQGHYLPGKPLTETPDNFLYQQGTWALRLRVRSKFGIYRHWELNTRRNDLHKCVTSIVMNLVGWAAASRMLRDVRKRHRLTALKKGKIWEGNLLWSK